MLDIVACSYGLRFYTPILGTNSVRHSDVSPEKDWLFQVGVGDTAINDPLAIIVL